MRISQLLSLIITSFILLSISCGSVFAKTISKEGAKQLQAELQKQLDEWQAELNQEGSFATLELDGPLLVEPARGYYAVTSPNIKFQMGPGSQIDFGMVAANMIPVDPIYTDAPDMWSVSLALPTPLFLLKENKIKTHIKIGSQKNTVLWVPDWGVALNNNSEFKNLEISDFETGMRLTIERAFNKGNLQPTEKQPQDSQNKLWDGFYSFGARGLTFEDPVQKLQLEIEDINYDYDIQGYDIAKIKSIQESMGEYESFIKDNPDALQAMDLDEVVLLIRQAMQSFESVTGRFEMGAMTIRNESKADQNFRIAGMKSHSNLRDDYFEMDMALRDMAPLNQSGAAMEEVFPLNIRVAYSMEEFPRWENIFQTLEAIETQMNLPETPTKAQKEAFDRAVGMAMLDLLQQAGTQIKVSDISMMAPNLGFRVEGDGGFAREAVYKAAGEVNVFITGLDYIAKMSQSAGQSNNEMVRENSGQIQQMGMFLPMLRSLGQVVEQGTETQPEVRLYKFNIGKSGEILLNGVDFSTIMGQFSGR